MEQLTKKEKEVLVSAFISFAFDNAFCSIEQIEDTNGMREEELNALKVWAEKRGVSEASHLDVSILGTDTVTIKQDDNSLITEEINLESPKLTIKLAGVSMTLEIFMMAMNSDYQVLTDSAKERYFIQWVLMDSDFELFYRGLTEEQIDSLYQESKESLENFTF